MLAGNKNRPETDCAEHPKDTKSGLSDFFTSTVGRGAVGDAIAEKRGLSPIIMSKNGVCPLLLCSFPSSPCTKALMEKNPAPRGKGGIAEGGIEKSWSVPYYLLIFLCNYCSPAS